MECFQDHQGESSSSEKHKKKQAFFEKPLFSSFVAKTLKFQGNDGFLYESACYNPKHNMIIACPGDKTMQFYDAATFEPCEERQVFKLKYSLLSPCFFHQFLTHP